MLQKLYILFQPFSFKKYNMKLTCESLITKGAHVFLFFCCCCCFVFLGGEPETLSHVCLFYTFCKMLPSGNFD